MVNNKVGSNMNQESQSSNMNMDNFLDGNKSKTNSGFSNDRANEFVSGTDINHSDVQSYAGRHDMYGKMNEPPFNRNPGNMPVSEFANAGNQFNQYGIHQMRGNMPPSTMNMNRNMGAGMPMGSYNQNSRMPMSAPNNMQQSGPTPTLNQLLTNANAGQRYPSNTYGHVHGSNQADLSNVNGGAYNNSWSGQQRPMGSFNQGGHYPNQGQMYDSQNRRMPMGNTGYPPPVNNMNNPYNYPGQRPNMGMPSQNYQQQMPPQYGSQGSFSGNGPTSQPFGNNNMANQPGRSTPKSNPGSNSPTPASQQQSPAPGQSTSSETEVVPQENSRPSSNATIIDENSNSGVDGGATSPAHTALNTTSCNSSTTSSIHSSSVTGNTSVTTSTSSSTNIPHPTPSPSGSTGSHSNTPTPIQTGPQGNPLNNVGETQNRLQSPMATQGFNMMPPPGNNSGYPGTGKMGPGGMHPMHPSHMPYNQPNHPFGNQGGTMGRPGGGPLQWNQQQNAYGMSGHHQNGPTMGPGPNMPMNRMSNHFSNYNHNQPMGMNNHINAMNNAPDNMPPNQTMPGAVHTNSMNMAVNANSGSNTTTTKGAQAAAQAAVEAAAKFAGTPNKEPMNKQPSMGSQGGGQRPNMSPYSQYNPGGPPHPGMNHYGMMNPGAAMNNTMNSQSPPPMNMPSSWGNNHMGAGTGLASNMPSNNTPSNATNNSAQSSGHPTERGTPTPNSSTPNNSVDNHDGCPPAVSSDQSLQAQLHNDSSQSSQISQHSSQDSVTSAPPQSNTPTTDDNMLPREVRITKHENMSHPATPASIVPSPSASLSSVHDEFENMNSPGWPGTTSQKIGSEGINKMFDMGDEPDRRPFLERLFAYMEDSGNPITAMPCISKQPIDLFKLFVVVRERGGVIEVTKSKKWRDVCSALNLGASGSAGFTLRKNYVKYLLSYECKFIHGGIDPNPIIAQLESMSTKKENRKNAAQNNMDTFRSQHNNQGFDGYGHNQFGPGGPVGQNQMGMSHPNMMPTNQGMNQGMMPNSQSMMPNTNMYDGGMMPGHGGMPPNPGCMPPNPASIPLNAGGMPPNAGGMPPNAGGMPPNTGSMPPNAGGMPPNPGAMTPNPGGMPPNPGGMPPNPGGMPPNPGGMPPNPGAMPPNPAGMPPNASVMAPNHGMMNNMMNNSSMPNNMMGGNSPAMSNHMGPNINMPMVPNRPMPGNNNDSISVTDPFSDEANNQFHRQNSQLPPYSNYMNNYNMNRPNMSSSPSMFNANNSQSSTPSPAPEAPKSTVATPEIKNEPIKDSPNEQSIDSTSTTSVSTAASTVEGVTSVTDVKTESSSSFEATTNTTSSSATDSNNDTCSSQSTTSTTTTTNTATTTTTMTSTTTTNTTVCSPAPSPALSQTSEPTRFNSPQLTSSPTPRSMPSQVTPDYFPAQQQMHPYKNMGQGNHLPMYPGGPQRPFQPMADQYPQQNYNNMMNQQQSMYGQKPVGMSPDMYPQHKPYSNAYNIPPNLGPGQQQWGGPMQQHPNQQRYTGSPNNMGPGMNSSLNANNMNQPSHMPSLYNRMNTPQHRLSPHRPSESKHSTSNAQSLTPQLMYSPHKSHQQKQMPSATHSYPLRKDVTFPPDSVEATRPTMTKKRKITAKDLAPVDPWRLMMALKSGLLAESTWALDTLTVLLYDDNTVTYFHLQNMPGLVEVLLEHYRHCLIAIFDTFQDLEINTKRCEHGPQSPNNSINNDCDNIHDISVDSDTQCDNTLLPECTTPNGITEDYNGTLLVTPDESSSEQSNYTYHTRQGKPVKIEKNSNVINTVVDPKHWDKYEGFDSGMHMWMLGQGCVTDHVVTQFESSVTKSKLRQSFYGKKNMEILENVSEQTSDVSVGEKQEPLEQSIGEVCKSVDGESSKADNISQEKQPCDNDNVKCEESSCSKKEITESKENNQEINKESVKEEQQESIEKDENSDSCNEQNTTKNSNQSIKFTYYPKGDDDECMKFDLSVVESLKRNYDEIEGESESYIQDKLPLDLCTQTENEISQRCICLSNIIRNLSFLPGNEADLSKHRTLMTILGRLLLLHHEHPKKSDRQKNYGCEIDIDGIEDDVLDNGTTVQWWWDTLEVIRENTLVTLANIAGYMNLQQFPEEVSLPILDGLLHWAVCPSSYAMDTMPSMSARSDLTPQRLVLETMSKLCVCKTNVDLLLATPPYSRILHLISFLVRLLSDKKEQVLREFSIVLLCTMVEGSSSAARAIALHQPSVALLIDFIENAELAAQQMNLQVSSTIDQSEFLGTTLDMLKRVASALSCISKIPLNKSMFIKHQPRLLQLVMSHYLDQTVSSHLADVLYRCSQS